MEFKEALRILKIEEYGSQIFSSNSRGELFHLEQYFNFAEHAKKTKGFSEFFSRWFKFTVELTKKQWERPESVFQHIEALFMQYRDDMIKQSG